MIPFLENKKLWRFLTWKEKSYQVSFSCFLIDMKIISKLLQMFCMDNFSFSDPHLCKIILKAIHSRSKIKNSWNLEFWASKIMESGVYCTKMKQNKSIKLLKVLFKYTFLIKWQNNAIIISVNFLVELIVQSPKKLDFAFLPWHILDY